MKRDLKWVEEEYLQRVAHIMGDCSASANALKTGEQLRTKGDSPLYFEDKGVLYVVPESLLSAATVLTEKDK